MPQPDEELLRSERFRVVRRRFVGKDGRELAKDVILHPGAVTILPLLPDDCVCLIRNHRLAVGETLLELPAGTLEPGEDPAETARRELIEETGWSAARIEHLLDFWMSPGILRERMHLFAAHELSPGAQQLMADEEIETLVLPWQEAMRLAASGQIHDAKTLVGLFFWDRRRQKMERMRRLD